MIFNLTGGGGSGNKLPSFTYTGTYELVDDGKAGTAQNWRLKLLTSGTLTFTRQPGLVDVFCVGGGGGGGKYAGGGGGYTTTQKSVAVTKGMAYEIVVGAGGSGTTDKGGAGGQTTALGVVAEGAEAATGSGFGSNGGSGGGSWYPAVGGTDGGNGGKGQTNSEGYTHPGGTGQGRTTREFGEKSGSLYAGGGGSGYDHLAVSDAGLSIDERRAKVAGGNGGGGDGVYPGAPNNAPVKGTDGLGGGGGGANGYETSLGADGGSGIVILRNHRSASGDASHAESAVLGTAALGTMKLGQNG